MEQRFDLHIHSCHSPDCKSCPADLFAAARRAGLSGVAITDHDSFGGSQEALALAPRDLLVVPGVEFSTEYGHILCYFLKDDPYAAGLRKGADGFFAFDELCAFACAQNAELFAAHPYRGTRFTEALLPRLRGIEAFNGGNTPRRQDANDRACALAGRLNLPFSAGSDAHPLAGVGTGARILDLPEHPTLAQFRAALTAPGGAVFGRYSPAAPEHFWYAQMFRGRKKYRRAAKQLAMGLAGALLYDPFAPLRASTRAIARGAVITIGGSR